MNIFVKVDTDATSITAISSHPFATSIANWIMIDSSVVDQSENCIIVKSSTTNDTYEIGYDDFVKYFYQFVLITVNSKKIVAFKSGVNISTYNTSRLTTLDMSVPLSFTRANTIVNFGRL